MAQADHHFAVRYPDLTQFPKELDEKIAVHGLHLKSQKPVQVGQTVGLQFRFPQREDPLLAVGVIAWVGSQADEAGKKSLIVKHLEFNADAQQVLGLVRDTPEVQEAEVPGPPQPATAPPPPPPPPPPAPEPGAATASEPPLRPMSSPAGDEATDFDDPEPAPESDRRKWIVLGTVAVLLIGLAAWLFGFGGMRYIAIRFMKPPPAYNIGYDAPALHGVEPPIPGKPAPPPKPKAPPPVVAIGFDSYQRTAVNEFIVTFNRPVPRIVTSRIESPLVQTFYIERARVNLDKEQYFLPYDLVRTVSFEADGGALRIQFVAQNPHYLPEPNYTRRGRELIIKFIATD